MDVGQRRCPGRRSRPYPQLFAALPATVLVGELAPLGRGKAAVRVPVLAQALPLLGRHGAELLPAPLEHPLSLLGELLVALVVLPRAPLLLGGERLPGPPVPLLGARGRRREREENDGEGDPASHPFAGGSCPSGVAGSSSSVVVSIASKFLSLSRLRSMGMSTNRSGASASLEGGSAGGGTTFAKRRGAAGADATPCASVAGAGLTAGAPEIRPVRSTMPIATTSTAAVASANAGSGSQSLQRRAGARSASSAAASRTRRRVACSRLGDTVASIGSPSSAVSIRSVTASSRRHAAQTAR